MGLARTFFSHWLRYGAAMAFLHTVSAADTYRIYLQDTNQQPHAEQIVRAALPKDSAFEVKLLPADCRSQAEAKTQAEAINAGVMELPCLVVSDEQGPYAVLRLAGLTTEQVQAAKALATAPERAEQAAERDFAARLYLLCASLCVEEASDADLTAIVTECRALLEHSKATEEQKQFIGYRCLYPALLLQYSRGYTGAHTPYTEAKLLEAIAALEAARDLNRETKIGKQAFDERERLRRARREARKYE